MNKKNTLAAIPLMAIAVIAIGLVGMSHNVFAQPTSSSSANVDQQGQHGGQYGDQTGVDKSGPEGAESPDSGSDSASDTDNLQQ
ncbi:MAG: hypothetical protein KGI02_05280 [Thaumarchaeota archaeon]|nr:hypothetical protein [Nitrososphaerota archaeon]MDE1831768.1 hypothetical protein [Nitrososphaerota archaeon]MDE1840600.1 hypothetical protein [Nitrososphaerota archaeon]MDE1877540.1 hypothetical protein [Nitrososphaerota archaeon]